MLKKTKKMLNIPRPSIVNPTKTGIMNQKVSIPQLDCSPRTGLNVLRRISERRKNPIRKRTVPMRRARGGVKTP